MKHATYDQVVPREMYVRVVKRIKCKYNTEWLEKWKTRTDTTKHVYEDINTGLSKLFPSKLVFGKHNVFVLSCRSGVSSGTVRDGKKPDRDHTGVCIILTLLFCETSLSACIFLGNSKQTFVDLGCGNGLLVDILTQEGYSGFGIDLNPVCISCCICPPSMSSVSCLCGCAIFHFPSETCLELL